MEKYERLHVFVPVFNGEECIQNTLSSCLGLGYTKIIVVDNCSSDSTCDLVRTFIDNNSNNLDIELIINKNNIGRVGNWNKCIDYVNENNVTAFTFLMVGDEAIYSLELEDIFKEIYNNRISRKARLIFSPVAVNATGDDTLVKRAEFDSSIISCSQVLYKVSERGVLFLGPLQGNIYLNLDGKYKYPYFSSDVDSYFTDQFFIGEILDSFREDSVLLTKLPFFRFNLGKKRTHTNISIYDRALKDVKHAVLFSKKFNNKEIAVIVKVYWLIKNVLRYGKEILLRFK